MIYLKSKMVTWLQIISRGTECMKKYYSLGLLLYENLTWLPDNVRIEKFGYLFDLLDYGRGK